MTNWWPYALAALLGVLLLCVPIWLSRRTIASGAVFSDLLLIRLYEGIRENQRPAYAAVLDQNGDQIARIERGSDLSLTIWVDSPHDFEVTSARYDFQDDFGNHFDLLGNLAGKEQHLRIKFSTV